MNDYGATLIACGITALGLWFGTRKSNVRYIRWQWRKPHWILIRLLALFLVLHGVFIVSEIGTARGFVVVAVVAGLVYLMDYTGYGSLLVAGLAMILYEWIFWFPSRRQLILRNPRPAPRVSHEQIIGLEGVAVSDLRPTGNILVRGIERPARAETGFISKGESVVVASGGDFEVTVRKTDDPHPIFNGERQTLGQGGTDESGVGIRG